MLPASGESARESTVEEPRDGLRVDAVSVSFEGLLALDDVTLAVEPGEDRYELVSVRLTDLGGGRTEMHFEQRGDHTPDEYERTKTGWGTFFARIDERLLGLD